MGLYFQTNNWEAYAIEPNKDASEFLSSYRLKVLNAPVEEADVSLIKNISFVNLEYVLEHLSCPQRVLVQIYNTLVPGGIVRIIVPNDFSEGQLMFQEKFNEQPHWVCLPDHINYFNFDSLSQLLKKVGFKEIYRTTNFPLEFLLMGGINYYMNETDKAKVSPFILNFENSFRTTGRTELLDKLYENLAQLGFGRAVFIYAIK